MKAAGTPHVFGAGDIVHYGSRGTEKRRWRVKAFLQRVEDSLDDSAESIDHIVEEVIRESVALERQERRAKGLPANRRYTFRHCLPADATHLKLSGVCGAIAPIDECEYLKQVEWTPDAIQKAINYANALGDKGNQLIGCWRWE